MDAFLVEDSSLGAIRDKQRFGASIQQNQSYQDSDNEDQDRGLRRINSAILTSSTSRKKARATAISSRSPTKDAQETGSNDRSRESTDSLPLLNDAPEPSQFQQVPRFPASVARDRELLQEEAVCSSPLVDLTTRTTADQDEGPSVSFMVSPGLSTGIQRKASQSSFLSVLAAEGGNAYIQHSLLQHTSKDQATLQKIPSSRKSRPLEVQRTPPQPRSQVQPSQSTLRSTKVSMTPVISGMYEASEVAESSAGDTEAELEEGYESPSPSPAKKASPEKKSHLPVPTCIFAEAKDLAQQTNQEELVLAGRADLTTLRTAARKSRSPGKGSQPARTAVEIANGTLATFVDFSPVASHVTAAAAVPSPISPVHPAADIDERRVVSSQSPPAEELPELASQRPSKQAVPTQSGRTATDDQTPPMEIPSSQTPPLAERHQAFVSPPTYRFRPSAFSPPASPQIPAQPVVNIVAEMPGRSPSVSYVEDTAYQQDAFMQPAEPDIEEPIPVSDPLTESNLRRYQKNFDRKRARHSYDRNTSMQPSLPHHDFGAPTEQHASEGLQTPKKPRRHSFDHTEGGRRAFTTPSPSPLRAQAAQQNTSSSPWENWQHIGKSGSGGKLKRNSRRSQSVASVATTFSPPPRTRDRSRRGGKGKNKSAKRGSSAHQMVEPLQSSLSYDELVGDLPKRRQKAVKQPVQKQKRKRRGSDDSENDGNDDDEDARSDETSFERPDWDDSASSSSESGKSKATNYDEDRFLQKTSKNMKEKGGAPVNNKSADKPKAARKKPAPRSSTRYESVALSQNDVRLQCNACKL